VRCFPKICSCFAAGTVSWQQLWHKLIAQRGTEDGSGRTLSPDLPVHPHFSRDRTWGGVNKNQHRCQGLVTSQTPTPRNPSDHQTMDADAALTELQHINQLTILDLAYPILNPSSSSATKRTSGVSDASNQANITPALLAADLAHYRDLFSKLRFSYVEQVTKERLLRAITSDPPEFVESSANAELGEKLKVDKAALKEKKEELQTLIGELEAQGRSLANRTL